MSHVTAIITGASFLIGAAIAHIMLSQQADASPVLYLIPMAVESCQDGGGTEESCIVDELRAVMTQRKSLQHSASLKDAEKMQTVIATGWQACSDLSATQSKLCRIASERDAISIASPDAW